MTLIFSGAVVIVAAMFRFVVLVFSIVWASLLLLSWSGAETPSPETLSTPSDQISTRN